MMWKLLKSEISYYGTVLIIEYLVLLPVLLAHIYLSKAVAQTTQIQQWPATGFVLLTIGVLFILAYTRNERTKTERFRLLALLPVPRSHLFWLRLAIPFLFWVCLWAASLFPFIPEMIRGIDFYYPGEFSKISAMLFFLILFGYIFDDLRYYRFRPSKYYILFCNGMIMLAYIIYLFFNLARYDVRPYQLVKNHIPASFFDKDVFLLFIVGMVFLLVIDGAIFSKRRSFLK